MAWVVYRILTGELIGVCRLSDLTETEGLAEKQVSDIYLGQVVWNEELKDYVYVESLEDRILTPLEFLTKFTAEERISLESITDTNPIVKDIFFLLDHTDEVHLDNPIVINALNYFQQLGVLSESRKNEILG